MCKKKLKELKKQHKDLNLWSFDYETECLHSDTAAAVTVDKQICYLNHLKIFKYFTSKWGKVKRCHFDFKVGTPITLWKSINKLCCMLITYLY